MWKSLYLLLRFTYCLMMIIIIDIELLKHKENTEGKEKQICFEDGKRLNKIFH